MSFEPQSRTGFAGGGAGDSVTESLCISIGHQGFQLKCKV